MIDFLLLWNTNSLKFCPYFSYKNGWYILISIYINRLPQQLSFERPNQNGWKIVLIKIKSVHLHLLHVLSSPNGENMYTSSARMAKLSLKKGQPINWYCARSLMVLLKVFYSIKESCPVLKGVGVFLGNCRAQRKTVPGARKYYLRTGLPLTAVKIFDRTASKGSRVRPGTPVPPDQ